MITIGYCTKESNINHTNHLIKTCGLGDKKVEIIEIINTGERSLTECYNEILKTAKYDHVVFCHDDIDIETKQWGTKLLKQFSRNPTYGIIGVAGTKYLASSGRWWEDTSKMYGRVAHTHEGKTWLSSYSDDLGHNLEKVILVDGVFFAVDKRLLLSNFDETVLGFHFYDVSFCFDNFIKGVNIGVSTMIRINHKSIGRTNTAWEVNRETFAENYKVNLPVTIKRVIHKNEKLRVILSSMRFNNITNKEKIMLELAIKLRKNGHDVTITSTLGGALDNLARKNDIKLANIMEPAGFKLGDGKWVLKSTEGDVPSVEKTLYKVKPTKYDLIHVFDDELIDHFKKLYGNTPLINTNFSDGLYVQPDTNPNVNSTVELKNNLDIVNTTLLGNVLKVYSEAI